jgi:hypothetical protein
MACGFNLVRQAVKELVDQARARFVRPQAAQRALHAGILLIEFLPTSKALAILRHAELLLPSTCNRKSSAAFRSQNASI